MTTWVGMVAVVVVVMVMAFNCCKGKWAVARQKEGGGRKVATGDGDSVDGCCGGNPHVNDFGSGCTISYRIVDAVVV